MYDRPFFSLEDPRKSGGRGRHITNWKGKKNKGLRVILRDEEKQTITSYIRDLVSSVPRNEKGKTRRGERPS